ncbi:hypothetical protein [Phaffia rhodozyma]|uniref:Uncharacterized protein n=1 Tax=Phaffia rhodozyma TaxID=264483 RepID=A0A0F7SPQ3_PHARH|nr:hypothetical protein [Phaffia rhodozyma]
MFAIPRREIYEVTASSPLVLSPTSVAPTPFGSRTTVFFRDFDGQGKQFSLIGTSLAKVVIDNSSNFTLDIHTPLLSSTLEVFSSSSIHVRLLSPTIASTVQLDPPLQHFRLDVPTANPSPKIIVSSVLPPSKARTILQEDAFMGSQLSALVAGSSEDQETIDCQLKNGETNRLGEQLVYELIQDGNSWSWSRKELKREEGGGEGTGYPML